MIAGWFIKCRQTVRQQCMAWEKNPSLFRLCLHTNVEPPPRQQHSLISYSSKSNEERSHGGEHASPTLKQIIEINYTFSTHLELFCLCDVSVKGLQLFIYERRKEERDWIVFRWAHIKAQRRFMSARKRGEGKRGEEAGERWKGWKLEAVELRERKTKRQEVNSAMGTENGIKRRKR